MNSATLSTATVLVEFRPAGRTVTVTTKRNGGNYPANVGPWERHTLSLSHARAEYRRLVRAGYRPW